MKIRKNVTTAKIERLKNTYNYTKSKQRSANRIILGDGELTFRSEFEFNIAILLDHYNIDFEYESQEEYLLYTKKAKWNKHFERFGLTKEDMSDVHHLYLPDFSLKGDYDGILLEPKGHFSQQDRTKMINIVNQNKDKKIIMVLCSPRAKVTTKLKAEEWCDKHKIEHCTIEKLYEKIKEVKDGK